ncbi:hypothetical protein GDO81_028900 [Engystomops pustulosus]|uniref:Uncharacterized protein n=1 Tax=Engystomops pustulosus TaxID=76066 RepID=A0AAV6YI79_ENGPU|nr:hypothetical protein GDO81_028900 [Engystomops pustulosus]
MPPSGRGGRCTCYSPARLPGSRRHDAASALGSGAGTAAGRYTCPAPSPARWAASTGSAAPAWRSPPHTCSALPPHCGAADGERSTALYVKCA